MGIFDGLNGWDSEKYSTRDIVANLKLLFNSNQRVLRMSHAIIRGKNGRRHEVNLGDDPVRVEVYASEETVEIFVEADFETLPEERRRFVIINIPRQQFSQATGEAARRAKKN